MYGHWWLQKLPLLRTLPLTKTKAMKRTIIASLVGGLIIFAWQFLSFAAVNFHAKAQGHTDKQESILQFLNSQQLPEGGYIMPTLPQGATMDEWNAMMKNGEGKPWASIQYHKSLENNMTSNMIRGFGVNVIIIALFCSLIGQFREQRFSTVFSAALITGMIIFLNAPYTNAIWYESFDTWAHLADAVVSWGLAGAWLGWYLNRKKKEMSKYSVSERRSAVSSE
jgi:hypothetical protein